MIIPESATHSVIDSTKIKSYQGCPRRFFFEYVLGWRLERPDHNLHFGSAVHLALEHMYDKWKARGKPGFEARDIVEGWAIFEEDYRKKFDAESDERFSPKEPYNTMRLLTQYAEAYKNDHFDVIHTEISGSVPIGATTDGRQKEIYFRLDTVCKDERGHFILEHKTSSWDTNRWAMSFKGFSAQVGTGCHVLYCLFDNVYGLVLNGLFFRKPPRTRKDGEPYASDSQSNEFLRKPMRLRAQGMEDWLAEMNQWYDDILADMDKLAATKETDDVMACFKRNPNHCLAYNRPCEYMDWCEMWHNPARESKRGVPVDFHVEFWDPRNNDKAYTDKVKL